MRARQQGVTLTGLIMWSFVLAIAALLVMRLAPSYIEYFNVKKAVVGIAKDTAGGGASVTEVRRLFENRAAIDDFSSVRSTDLQIVKEGNGYLISANYRREIPLIANIGVYIDFEVSSR